jgi:hypothetical protein
MLCFFRHCFFLLVLVLFFLFCCWFLFLCCLLCFLLLVLSPSLLTCLSGHQISCTLPYIRESIPVVIVFRALGFISDKDILEHIVYDFNDIDMMERFRPSLEEASPIRNEAIALDYIGKRGNADNVIRKEVRLSCFFRSFVLSFFRVCIAYSICKRNSSKGNASTCWNYGKL